MSNTETLLREELLQVFGFESIEEIKPEDSFVNDLDADSLDFVEIIYVIEKKFDVKVTIKELLNYGHVTEDSLFDNEVLNEEGVITLSAAFPDNKELFFTGMTKLEMFGLLTVRNLAKIIESKME